MPSGSQAASSYASTARTLNSTCIGAKNAVLRHVCTIDCDAVDVDRLADQVDMCSMRTLLVGLAGLVSWLGRTRRHQTSSRAAMPTTQSIHPPPGSRTRHCPRHPTTWQRRQDGAQDTFLHSRLGSFTPCRWHQRRFAMPGATVDPAGTSGSLAGRTEGMVRRKAIPQAAVS